METKIHKLYIRLLIFFWANVILFASVLIAMLLIFGPQFDSDTKNSVIFERWTIILTLVAIPGALKLFHVLVQKSPLLPDVFFKRFTQLFLLRIAILDITLFVNLLGFYLFQSVNFIYMCIVVIFALFFCYPNKGLFTQIENDIKNKDI